MCRGLHLRRWWVMVSARRALGWVEWVDRWVPAALHRDPIVRRRARVIVFNVAVLVSYLIARIALELLLEPLSSAWRTVLPLAFGSAGGVGLTVWLWRRGDPERASQVGMWIVIGVAVAFTLAKGGMRSPGLFWFAVVPVLARACAGSRAVILTTALVTAFLIGCSTLDLLGIELSGAPVGTQLAVERLVALLAAT